jgi:DNA-binding MarR family transcriptional regulator
MKFPLHTDPYVEALQFIKIANKMIYEFREEELKPLGISMQQLDMLRQIHTLGNESTITNIAIHLHRNASSISSMLVRLERKGLVQRFISPDDRRNIHVFLSEKGNHLYDKKIKEPALLEKVKSQLSEDEIIELHRMLKEICVLCVLKGKKAQKSKKAAGSKD